MRVVMNKIKSFVKNPYANLLVGIAFLVSGLIETFDSLKEDIENLNFHGHHGIVIFATFKVLIHFTEVFEGLEYVSKEEE